MKQLSAGAGLFVLVFAAGSVAGCDPGSATISDPGDGPQPPGTPAPSPPAPMTPPESPPQLEPGPPTTLVIFSPDVLTLEPTGTDSVQVVVWDERGNTLTPESPITWSAQQPEIASVENGVVTAGARLGFSWIWAEYEGLRDSVGVWIQRPESEPSEFIITLFYSPDVPEGWRTGLEEAARRWEQVIRTPLPPADAATVEDVCGYAVAPPPEYHSGVETGVRIYVDVSDSFRGSHRAVGGQCSNRGLPSPTSVHGKISLNSDFLDVVPDDLDYLTHHEMGHTLGLVGGIQRAEVPWFDHWTEEFSGTLGLFGLTLDGLAGFSSVVTTGGHWPLQALMGTRRRLYISHASVGALMDTGYAAAWYGAGPL